MDFCAVQMQVLKTDVADLGSLRTMPYLVMFASSNFGGWLGDALVTRQQYATVLARRTINSIGESFYSHTNGMTINKSFNFS